MAELASGAVTALLGVIRDEARLLGGVSGDVKFIQEEMESMNSFLMHLARTAPPGGEHDEQVRTWMNQVRQLAQDCNNCIDIYLNRGNPDIHLAKGGFLRYLLCWLLQKRVAQHDAAIKLRALKERARDVGKRRLRYGVEVPGKLPTGAATSLSSSAYAATSSSAGVDAAEDIDEEDDDQLVVTGANDHSSICIVAPDDKETRAVANGAKTTASALYMQSVLVDIPAVHFFHRALLPRDILYYILRELELEDKPADSKHQEGTTDRDPGETVDLKK